MQSISQVGRQDKLSTEEIQLLQAALVEDARKVVRMRGSVWAVQAAPEWVQEVAFEKFVDMAAPTLAGKLGEYPEDSPDAGTRTIDQVFYIRKAARFHFKDLAASRQLGRALDASTVREMGRLIAELENTTLVNGVAGGPFGLLNATGILSQAGTDWDAAGDPYNDVRLAMGKLQDQNFFGPYQLIVSPTHNANLLKARSATDKTHREMIQAILTDIRSIVVDPHVGNAKAILTEGQNASNYVMHLTPDLRITDQDFAQEWTKIYALEGFATQVKRPKSICEITGI